MVNSQYPFLPKSVTLQLKTKDETIQIHYDPELLPSANDMKVLIEQEKPTLTVCVEAGLAYYRAKRYKDFCDVFDLVSFVATTPYYKDAVLLDVSAIDILAAYSVREGSKARSDKERRRTMYARATLLYTLADRMQMYDQSHLAGRAYFCLVEGRGAKLDQAQQQFTFVLKQNEDHIAAMMGMACIAFNKRDYKQALFYYKKCLKTKPDGPADFRVGIGMCLARMNQIEKARYAFERALEIDQDNVAALVALAVLDESEHTPISLANSIQRLGLAYKLEPEHPVVLVNLANHFFYRKEYDRVEQLGMHALTCSDSDSIKAEACFQLARCYHVQNNFEEAFKYYYQATTLNQHNYILPYYGLGQIYILKGEIPQARLAFETILKQVPNCTDSMKILGCLYAELNIEIAKAKELFTKYLQSFPDDTEVLIDLAQLLEHTDANKSLQLYEKAVALIIKAEEEIPPEITNNIASLYINQGKFEQALGLYKESEEKLIEIINTEETADERHMLVTVRYNIARCMEQLCLYDEAERRYKEILKEHPDYFDCVVRLGCVARDRGQVYDASMMFKEAISIEPTAEDPWLLIGLLHMTKHELGPAQKKFEHVLKMKDGAIAKQDAFTHVALGNVWMNSLFVPTRDRSNDEKYHERALVMYLRALKIQPKNMWATNGIGCILAHKKRWQEARDVFSQVREATSEFCDVWVNIAHIYMETRQYVPAIQMYSNAMRKFGKEKDHNLLVSLARAYYASGKLQECRETLERAMIESADNIQVKFNYAFILKKMSKRILEDTKATSIMVNGAIADLRTAERMFTYIHKNRDESLTNFKLVSRTASGEEAKQCQDLLKQAETYLTRALEQDRLEEEMRRKQEAERASLLQKIQQQKMDKESKAERRREEIATLRTAFKEMTRDCLRMPEVKEDEKKPRGGGRRRKGGDGDEFVNDSSDMGNWPGDGEEGGERRRREKSSKKAARKRREKKVIIGSGTDDEAEKPPKKRKKFEKTETKLSAKQSAKIKSRAFLSSESDSSDGPPPPAPDVNMEEDSPPPANNSSDSEASSPKPKKKKQKADSDESGNSDSDAPMQKGTDSDEPSTTKQAASSSGSESDTPKKRKKKAVSSSEPDSD